MSLPENKPRSAKLTLKRESLRELSAPALRQAEGGIQSGVCVVSAQFYCVTSQLVHRACPG